MKVLYYGKHMQQNNDDEGAIFKSLKYHGCEVTRLYDSHIENEDTLLDANEYDFVLFHKTPAELIQKSKVKKKIVWFFDALNKGFDANDAYIASVLPYVDCLFLTDGDYVDNTTDKRIHFLQQGYDHLVYDPISNDVSFDKTIYPVSNQILYTTVFIGTTSYPNKGVNAYQERCDYINLVSNKLHCHNTYSIFNHQLSKICAMSKAMVCLPPITDRYYSNRLYLLGGRGSILLHKESALAQEYFGDSVYFYNKNNFVDMIEMLNNSEYDIKKRLELRDKILEKHCYHHRVEQLLELVK